MASRSNHKLIRRRHVRFILLSSLFIRYDFDHHTKIILLFIITILHLSIHPTQQQIMLSLRRNHIVIIAYLSMDSLILRNNKSHRHHVEIILLSLVHYLLNHSP